VRILGDGERKKTRAFSELQSHYLFAEKFGRPAKGNDKGKVESGVKYVRRNFLCGLQGREPAGLIDLNGQLRWWLPYQADSP
jgi:transposase